MGVKFDAVKDDEYKVAYFMASDVSVLNKRINEFFGPRVNIGGEGDEAEYIDAAFRYIPISVSHSTETRPFTRGPLNFVDSTTTYHAMVVYKVVGIHD